MDKRWLWAALAVSLGLNIFIIGITLGRGLAEDRGYHAPPPRGGMERGGFPARLMMDLVPEEEGAELTRLFRQTRRTHRDMRRARRDLEDRIRAALVAEPYDQAVIDTLLTQYRQSLSAMTALPVGILEDVTARLDSDGRAALADHLFRREKRSAAARRRHGRLRDGAPPPDH